MRRYAPLLTLLAVVVLGGLLLTLNLFGDPSNQNGEASPVPGQAAVTATAAPTAAPTTAPTTAAPQADSATGAPSASTGAVTAAPAAPEKTAPATVAQAPPVVPDKAYTGHTAGREASVAIAVKNGRAVAYVCDGKKVEAWLQGSVSGTNLALKSKDGTSTIVGTVDADRSSGVLTIAGRTWPYDARTAAPPAGLYEGRVSVRGVLNRVGWIVQPDGTQTGVLQNGSGTAAAPVLDPARPGTVTIDGVPVVVRTIGGGDVVIPS